MKVKIPTKTDSGYSGEMEIEGTKEEIQEVYDEMEKQQDDLI